MADQVVLNFCKNKVAPTSVTHDPKGGKTKINIGLPIEYREGRIMGVLHHEVGTHFLRKYNEKFQVWYKKREKYELKNCIQTEEGFASINQLFEMVTIFILTFCSAKTDPRSLSSSRLRSTTILLTWPANCPSLNYTKTWRSTSITLDADGNALSV